MTRNELAQEIARGLIETGIEGGYDAVSCSTAGDYPSVGVSQWEGGRADALLESIPGGGRFAGRRYSDIAHAGDLPALRTLLESDTGRQVQLDQLTEDCLLYADVLRSIPYFDDSRCVIYAGMWCPTSHIIVSRFLRNRADRYNLRSLQTVYELFRDQYAVAAGVGEYAEGYANRAERTFAWVTSRDLTTGYGVPWYGQAGNGF